MALERRRILLPLALILLFSFLLFSFRSPSINQQDQWENEGLIPYEQEFEQAGVLKPYIKPPTPPPSKPIIEAEVINHTNQKIKLIESKEDAKGLNSLKTIKDIDNLPIKIPESNLAYDNPQDVNHEESSLSLISNPKETIQHETIESTNLDAITLKLTTNYWPVPKNPPRNGRYLSYLAHSGFHNQRISFVNALILAQMLDRTLLVSPATLGRAVDWVPTPLLQEHVEQAENSEISECKSITDKDTRRMKCGIYWNSRRASWSWLLDASALFSQQPLIDRPNHSKAFYFDSLGIKNSDTKTFDDITRNSYRFFETSKMEDGSSDPGEGYAGRLNIDELRDTTDGYMLLEFGSLYGSNRIVLEKTSTRHAQMEKLMNFKQPVLEKISEAVVESLGGRGNFIGLHLRVGHGDKFEAGSKERTAGVFKRLLVDAYGIDDKTASSLLAKNQLASSSLESPKLNSKTFYPSPNLACPSVLYEPTSSLVSLNTPLYIATDSPSPSKDPLINLFRNTFPCIFYLTDFRTANSKSLILLEPLEYLKNFVDDSPSVEPLERFLLPFIDAEIAAKGKTVVGTPGSTFSTYVKTTLFDSYSGTKSNNIGKGSFGKDDTTTTTSTSTSTNSKTNDHDDDSVVVNNSGSTKGKDRQSMLAAEKEIVKKPSRLDSLEDAKTKKPSTIGGALALTEKKKPSTTTTSGKVTSSEDELPDQLEEELKGELESAKEEKYLDENQVKEKFKADKLASELASHPHLDGDKALPASLELELEKATEGKFMDPLPLQGPSDVATSVQEELSKAKEVKFSDKGVVTEPLQNSKQQIKEANSDLIQELKKEEVKYVDEPKAEEVKEKSRLKPEIIVDESEYSEEY